MASKERFSGSELRGFCIDALSKLSVSAADAQSTADALLYADLRGIDSHGVAQLGRYVRALKSGDCTVDGEIFVEHETPSTALVDGGLRLGQPGAARSMEIAIGKAKNVGTSWVATKNSHHLGAAGYYASMALQHDMIGIALTNAGPSVLPTFGAAAQLGTNPIAIAVPTDEEPAYVLDMATSVKANGKIEILCREGGEAPPGWFIQADGSTGGDPNRYLTTQVQQGLGGLLPLGGHAEVTSGYKGFGLGLAVEILGPVLAGSIPGPLVPPQRPGWEFVSAHFFGAIRVDAFRPASGFKADMDSMLRKIKESPKAPGHDRIYIAGEKEHFTLAERSDQGIPLHVELVNELDEIATDLDITPLGRR